MDNDISANKASKLLSAAVLGVEAYIVEVESHLDAQLPMFVTVGLTDLRLEEAIETTMIHSVMGLLPKNKGLIATRPFRSPHHTVSEPEHSPGGLLQTST